MEEFSKIQNIVTIIIDFCVRYSFQIIGALIILGLGIYLAGWLGRLVTRLCQHRHLDITLTLFVARLVKLLVLTFVIIMALGKFGISVAPLIAALGAMAFGATFALQGPLSNYSAGLVIILTRPFVVGNTISINNVNGVVEEITLSMTVLSTEDGERITIPNKHIVGEILVNSFENKVVESSIGISYGDDPETAVGLMKTVFNDFPQIAKEPPPQVGLEAYGESAIQIRLRYWVPTKAYYETLFAVNLAIHKKLKEVGITIPFPRRDVRMLATSGRAPV